MLRRVLEHSSRLISIKDVFFGGKFRSFDLSVMGPPRFHCATPNAVLSRPRCESRLIVFINPNIRSTAIYTNSIVKISADPDSQGSQCMRR